MSLTRAACVALMSLAMAAPVLAQHAPMANPPRTADGRPDLQGAWSNQSVTTLTRDPSIRNVVLTPAEAAELESKFHWNVNERSQQGKTDVSAPPPSGLAGSGFGGGGGYNAFWLDHGRHYARVKGEIRSSWLVDPPTGQLPLKGGNRPVDYERQYGSFDGPETRPLFERCIAARGGPVIRNGLYNNNMQIVQTPDHVLINVEMIHDAQIVPIVKSRSEWKPRPDAIKPWFGDAFGWYDGDTLVVETTSVNPKQAAMALVSPTGKVVERFTRWSEDEILYEFAVDDPQLYSRPWRGEMTLRKASQPLYEYACHEGNYALPGILAGARKLEADGRTLERNAEEE